MSDPDDFVSAVAQRAPQDFDRAFDRWRELYNPARTQLMEANARSEITGLSARPPSHQSGADAGERPDHHS
jgi:hypothetical protein